VRITRPKIAHTYVGRVYRLLFMHQPVSIVIAIIFIRTKSSNILRTVHIVPRCRSPNPCLPQQQDTIPYAVKISVLAYWRWAKDCPKHVEL